MDFPGGSDGKVSPYNAGDPGSISGSGRSPGEGNGNSLQYSCLGNPMARGTWRAIVHGVAKNGTQLGDCHFHFQEGNHHNSSDASVAVTAYQQLFQSSCILFLQGRYYYVSTANSHDT